MVTGDLIKVSSLKVMLLVRMVPLLFMLLHVIIAAMEKTNEYMQAEAQAITATRKAMEAMQQVQTPKPTQQAPQRI